MLTVKIPEQPEMELYDSSLNEFVSLPRIKEQTLTLEHSLISVSLWEAKWKTPFLKNEAKTTEQTLDYIRCMTINKNVPPEVYTRLPANVIEQIQNYIDDPMTATTFRDSLDKKNNKKKFITSEEIYWEMIALNIPSEYEKWHLNRLLTLIRICAIKNQPPKKMSKREIFERNKAWNEKRRQELHSKG